MSIVTPPKVHQFFPLARNRTVQLPIALSGNVAALQEYQQATLSVGDTSFAFGDSDSPMRVNDIFLIDVEDDAMIQPNRVRPMADAGGQATLFDHEMYDFDVLTNTVHFHRPLEKAFQMRWYSMKRSVNFGADWIECRFPEMLVQGANYRDETLIPPDESRLTGKYQGGCRCYFELVSMTTIGRIQMSDDLMGFSYHRRMGFIGLDSAEYRVYNTWGQVSDTYCLTFQMN